MSDGERRSDYIELGKMQAHLDTLVKGQPKLQEDVTKLRTDVSALKVKAAGWGFASGSVGTILLYIKMKLMVE